MAFDRFYNILGSMGPDSTLVARRLGYYIIPQSNSIYSNSLTLLLFFAIERYGSKNLVQEGSRRNVGAPRTAELVELDLVRHILHFQ